MSQEAICIFCHPINGYTAFNAPEVGGGNCLNPPCPCENVLTVPAIQQAGVTQVYTHYHPNPTFPVVPFNFDPCNAPAATICYACNQANTGYISQTLPSGGPCPTGWETTIPECTPGGGASTSSTTGCAAPDKGCLICFDEACSSVGSLEISISLGTDLYNVNLQNGSQNTQISSCNVVTPNPFMTTAVSGDNLTVTAYCGTPIVEDSWNAFTAHTSKPDWAEPECGQVTISSNTKVYAFYDGTSLGASQAEDAYKALMGWLTTVANFTVDTVHGSSTQNVFHTAVAGERWVDWATAVFTGKFNNSQQTPYEQISVNGNAATDFTHCTGGSDCAVARNSGNTGYVSNAFNSPGTNSKCIAQLNWAFDTNTATANGQTWNVDEFYDTAEGSLIGSPMWNFSTSSNNGTQTWNGFPPAAANTDDVLIVMFADESMWSYHANDDNVFTVTPDPYTHSTGGHTYGGIDPQQPTPQFKEDYDKHKAVIAAHGGDFKAFLYPSRPASLSTSGGHKAFPLHALAAISSGDNVPADGMWSAGNSPTNQYATLTKIETENPYWSGTVPTYGGLDQFGWGINVDGATFNAATFQTDLEVFLGVNSVNCDDTDCARMLVVWADGTPIPNETVTLNGVNLQTDASGYTPFVSGLAGGVSINGCYTHNFTGDCTQYLFKLRKETESFTPTLECILGCTDPTAMNYNPNANVDDGSCEYCIWGCMNPTALNYNPLATCDDGTCQDLPDIVECTMINMAKEILKQCHEECGDEEAYQELLADYREMEAVLAQIYMLIECDKIEELQALMPKILRLMEKYQCDSCYNFNSALTDPPTQTVTETSATSCGATVSGPCRNKLLTPAPSALQIQYTTTPGASAYASTTANTTIGDITGKTLDVTSYCGPEVIERTLNSCGMSTIPNDTNIYCFYDVTSTCYLDIIEIVNSVELWYKSKVIADPTFSGDVYHIPVHGEKWLRVGEYPYTQAFHSASTSLVNGSGNDLSGGNSGYSTTLTVDVLDRSTIGGAHTMVSKPMYGPKSGTAAYNDIATGSGALPYLKPGASYTDQGLASGGTPDTKAVVLCFFDEAEGSQGGGHYHDRGHPGDSGYGYCPTGIIEDYGTAPGNKWITDYNSFTAMHSNYSFFKGFLYPVIPGIHYACGSVVTTGDPHTGKMSFLLNALSGIHSGVWNTATDGPVPVNPVVLAQAHPGNANVTAGTMGNLDAITLAGNPYASQGYDGLDQYGWSMDATVGQPGTNSIAGVFTSGQFNTTLDALLSGGSTCDGTDCLTVVIKDADSGAVLTDTYTQTAVTLSPGTHQLLDPSSNVTLTTLGECTEYQVTIFKDVMDTYSDCVVTSQINCGCTDKGPSITISVGAGTDITGVTDSGETLYGTITNETTGVTEDIIFDPDVAGPLTGSITLDDSIKNTALFAGDEMPDGRYKIVLNDVDGGTVELCYLILCDSYSKILDAFERYTLQIDCCPECTSPQDKYLEGYTIYRALKMTGMDCGLEAWIDKNIIKLQGLCSACGADAECNQTC